MSTPLPAKPRRSPQGLRQRLILALLLPMLLILIGSSTLDFHTAGKMADQTHDQALADTVFDLESHIGSKKDSGFLDLGEEAQAILRSNAPDTLFFSVRDARGVTLAGDTDLSIFPSPAGSRQIAFSDADYRGQQVRVALLRITRAGGDFVITVAETTLRRQQSRQRILAAMVLPTLAVIIATLLVVVLGVRQGLLPLRAVENEIARRSANDLSEIDLASAPLEIHPMLGRLNELFALLQKSSQIQQRFIADAAHQLRTPLAGLQNQLDLAAGEGAFGDNPERRERIEEATRRISHLLSQLLAYAQTEAANPAVVGQQPVPLQPLLENAASEFIDAALAKDIDLGFEIAPASVYGVPWMLHEALANLIDNALRYTPAGGVVTVRCGSEGAAPFIEVDDSGPGIPEAQRQNVFERFYRMPGTPGDGCGLGLPIVREIAQLHHAEVELLASPAGGLRVRIRFAQTAAGSPG